MSENHDHRLFLLDAYALIFRAYYAFIKNPRVNSQGLNTSAMFGFTNTLLEVLEKQKPTHIAVVFDSKTATAQRKEIFEDYKANRDETPEDIILSVPYIKKIIEGFNIPIIEAAGYEADDVIGTLAKMAEKEGYFTYMMTPDKDFGQLVSENIVMYKPARSGNGAEILGVKEICEKFGIERPEQVIDILGLWGDSVDNIPGVPGVGEKTAKKFIAQYGSIEGLYENVDEIKGKLREKVESNQEQALMSKKLATILTDAPVQFDPDSLIIDEPKTDILREVFGELEFRRIAQRVLGESLASSTPAIDKNGQTDLFGIPEPEEENPKEPSKSSEEKYHFTNTEASLKALIALLSHQKQICFDTETNQLAPVGAKLVGISFAISAYEAFYVPFPQEDKEAKEKIQKLAPIFSDADKTFIGHNIKYDILVLKNYGVNVEGQLHDTMMMHYFLEPDMRRRSMDALAEIYLNHKTIPIEDLIGKKGKNQKSMADLPQEDIVNYACEDADITFRLYQFLASKLKDVSALNLIKDLEAPLIKVLADMEFEGISLDVSVLEKLSVSLEKEAEDIEQKIFEHAGHAFNIASPKQVGEVLFEELNIVDKPKKTKSGQYATNEDVLSKISSAHLIVEDILEYRELKKLQNTYVKPLPDIVNNKTGRIHTTFQQMVAATGRLSSDKPNLQNIPIRTERGRHIREAFIPSKKGNVLLSADYSQVELRIMAALSGDENMVSAFKEGKDIHAATAARVFDIDLDDVSREQRSKAKMVNFGIIYGISAFGLADRLNISRTEAKDIIDSYFEKYPQVKSYMDSSIDKARDLGYCETIMGRKRYLRDINSQNHTVRSAAERNAINAPIQGSAADVIKKAMLDIHRFLSNSDFKAKMLLQVHDELIFDLPEEELKSFEAKVVELMESAVELAVPLVVESGSGANWLEAH